MHLDTVFTQVDLNVCNSSKHIRNFKNVCNQPLNKKDLKVTEYKHSLKSLLSSLLNETILS